MAPNRVAGRSDQSERTDQAGQLIGTSIDIRNYPIPYLAVPCVKVAYSSNTLLQHRLDDRAIVRLVLCLSVFYIFGVLYNLPTLDAKMSNASDVIVFPCLLKHLRSHQPCIQPLILPDQSRPLRCTGSHVKRLDDFPTPLRNAVHLLDIPEPVQHQ